MSLTATKQWARDERRTKNQISFRKVWRLTDDIAFHGNGWRLWSDLDYCVVGRGLSWCTESKIAVAVINFNKLASKDFEFKSAVKVSRKVKSQRFVKSPCFQLHVDATHRDRLFAEKKYTELFSLEQQTSPSFTTRTSNRPHNCGESIEIPFWLPEGGITESTTKAQWKHKPPRQPQQIKPLIIFLLNFTLREVESSLIR